MPVSYCKNSTISEAWGLICGLPARLDDTDTAVLLRAAKEHIPKLQQKPAIVSVNVIQELTQPFWREQVAWEDERYIARFGHRYLSVHFLKKAEKRYETFATSLKPALDTWLKLYENALTTGDDKHPVDRIAFGYVNTFEFELDGFDLSRFFKMSFGVVRGITRDGLTTIDIGCTFFDQERNAYLSVNLSVESPSRENSKIRIITKVLAEKRGLEGVSYANRDQLDMILLEAKSAAKDTFFNCATDETHEIMGAVNDASS